MLTDQGSRPTLRELAEEERSIGCLEGRREGADEKTTPSRETLESYDVIMMHLYDTMTMDARKEFRLE